MRSTVEWHQGSELALADGVIPLCLADSGDIVKIAADLQLVQHPSRLSRHAGRCQNYSPYA